MAFSHPKYPDLFVKYLTHQDGQDDQVAQSTLLYKMQEQMQQMADQLQVIQKHQRELDGHTAEVLETVLKRLDALETQRETQCEDDEYHAKCVKVANNGITDGQVDPFVKGISLDVAQLRNEQEAMKFRTVQIEEKLSKALTRGGRRRLRNGQQVSQDDLEPIQVTLGDIDRRLQALEVAKVGNNHRQHQTSEEVKVSNLDRQHHASDEVKVGDIAKVSDKITINSKDVGDKKHKEEAKKIDKLSIEAMQSNVEKTKREKLLKRIKIDACDGITNDLYPFYDDGICNEATKNIMNATSFENVIGVLRSFRYKPVEHSTSLLAWHEITKLETKLLDVQKSSEEDSLTRARKEAIAGFLDFSRFMPDTSLRTSIETQVKVSINEASSIEKITDIVHEGSERLTKFFSLSTAQEEKKQDGDNDDMAKVMEEARKDALAGFMSQIGQFSKTANCAIVRSELQKELKNAKTLEEIEMVVQQTRHRLITASVENNVGETKSQGTAPMLEKSHSQQSSQQLAMPVQQSTMLAQSAFPTDVRDIVRQAQNQQAKDAFASSDK